jgi:predicted DNA-binding transcriptional regulator YafY
MSTRLTKIVDVNEETIDPAAADRIIEKIRTTLESRKTEAVVEVSQGYNKELSRILYAFSCFDKKVEYDEDSDKYTIQISLLSDEQEYLLSKIRFLGKRVRVVEGGYLKRRMLEASTKALERYGESGSE